ncbi:GNAT family N-acetyltransferase [Cellulomonas hominis]|uniref:GNAT family N-acetyltransferase n=1 Tax=Cellulomonas hominis TaxID=156981 RepID=UPI001B98085F|nr:GNAT family N-acetyltransferase [Cellulomonas hominis]VTR78197.1 hypothetical protein CHMI_02973 [Cellulomonas hominis]
MTEPELITSQLSELDDLEGFDCGVPGLDEWLRRHARRAHKDGTAVTTVWRRRGDGPVVGYYSICPTEIRRDGLTRRWHGGVTTVPGFMLARLALDTSVHGQGLGTQILLDALETICDASTLAGGRVVVVDPVSADAASFYGRYGFEAVNGSTRMFLLVDDARAALGLGPA